MGATRRPPFWSDLAGDEGGEACGGWAREAGKGGVDWGGAPEQCGSNKACTGCVLWLVTRGGRRGGAGPGRRARGG